MLVHCKLRPGTLVVEVFKTNITDARQAEAMLRRLYSYMPQCRINFDLEDEDNILRVEGLNVVPEHIAAVLEASGFTCIALE